MSDEALISVVVCTRGRAEALERCLRSLERLRDDAFEIVAVDNNAVPSVRAPEGDARIRVIHQPRRGLNVARNTGVREARGDIVAFIDDDCEADEGWLEGLRKTFVDEDVTFVTGRVVAASLRPGPQRWFEELMSFDRGLESHAYIGGRRGVLPRDAARLGTGCNMAFRRELFDRVGPFDEALDMGTLVGGGGDIDYFARVLGAAEVAAYTPGAVVRHHHRESRSALRWQLFGYGASVGALSLKFVFTHDGRRLRVTRTIWSWLRWLWVLIVVRVRRYATFPPSMLAVQVAGFVWGPVGYLLSRRITRRHR